MPGGRVGVLADNDNSDRIERLAKGAKNVADIGGNAVSRFALGLYQVVDARQHLRDPVERRDPTRVDSRQKVGRHVLFVGVEVDRVGKFYRSEERLFAALGRNHRDPRVDGDDVVVRGGLAGASAQNSERDVSAFVR